MGKRSVKDFKIKLQWTYDSEASGVGQHVAALVRPEDEVLPFDVAERSPELGGIADSLLGQDVRETSDPGQGLRVPR